MLVNKVPSSLRKGYLIYRNTITNYELLIISLAARLPISTAKFVPRSHGYTWLIEAKYKPSMGVCMEGIFFE